VLSSFISDFCFAALASAASLSALSTITDSEPVSGLGSGVGVTTGTDTTGLDVVCGPQLASITANTTKHNKCQGLAITPPNMLSLSWLADLRMLLFAWWLFSSTAIMPS
jgi:hypothetical protein